MILGLDVGGTNIDAVLIENQEIIRKVKYPLYDQDLLETILIVLDKLLVDCDRDKIKRINLSTTVSTNAIVNNKLSTVGMLIQSGPGLMTDTLACGDQNKFLAGSIDHRGRIVKNLDLQEIEEAIQEFKEEKIETCSIVTKFSTRNPGHEDQIKAMANDSFAYITRGHTMSGKLNFPRRVHTSYLNSAIYETFNHFASKIEQSLEKMQIGAPIYILKADGGTMDMRSAMEKPVETILSGPAASFMGMSALIPTLEDGVFLDIGGTTTDIFFLVDGIPVFEPLGIQIGEYKTLVRSIYSLSIGLGGDSQIKIEEGKLKIGPKKAKLPYALGGSYPTPTDAMIYLGIIEDGDKQKAEEIMEKLGVSLGLSAQATSQLILDTMGQIIKEKVDECLQAINKKPVYTVKEVLEGRQIVPKQVTLIGGPAEGLAPILEDAFNLPCYYPGNFHIANAIGAALARPTMHISLSADTERRTLSVPELAIYEKIKGRYTLEDAKKQAIELLEQHITLIDPARTRIDDGAIEIIEENSFNMVDGFRTTGQNIRVQAQVKPGLIDIIRSEK